MSEMTLEQVRDWLRDVSDETLASHRYAMADAIDAHLAQPAQAVDVVSVLDHLHSLAHRRKWSYADLDRFDQVRAAVTRALSSEKAQTLADFVNLPDAERAAVGQKVAASVDAAMGEKAEPVGGWRVPEVFREQMEMLRDDFHEYAKGNPKVPFVIVREALVAALNVWDDMPIPASPAPDKEGM